MGPAVGTIGHSNGNGGWPPPGNFVSLMAAIKASQTPLTRKEEFSDRSVIDAMLQILASVDELHADDLVKRIFVTAEPYTFQRAKSAVVSEAIHAVKRGLLKRTGPNTFALVKKNDARKDL